MRRIAGRGVQQSVSSRVRDVFCSTERTFRYRGCALVSGSARPSRRALRVVAVAVASVRGGFFQA